MHTASRIAGGTYQRRCVQADSKVNERVDEPQNHLADNAVAHQGRRDCIAARHTHTGTHTQTPLSWWRDVGDDVCALRNNVRSVGGSNTFSALGSLGALDFAFCMTGGATSTAVASLPAVLVVTAAVEVSCDAGATAADFGFGFMVGKFSAAGSTFNRRFSARPVSTGLSAPAR